MKSIYLLPILLLIMISCKNERQEKLEKDIIGEWKFIKEIDSSVTNESIPEIPFRIFFMSDFSCEAGGKYKEKSGFWEVIEDTTKFAGRMNKYCGWDSEYRIKNDSLSVLDQCSGKWRRSKIYTLDNEKLIYQMGEKHYCLFEKRKYKIDPREKYDQIIVSSSGCYGSCPIANISIAANGKVTYEGSAYNLKNGNYNAKITPQKYLELEKEFKRAGIDTLKTNYSAGWTDDQTITATFIRNGRIYKTVYDYGFQAPSEFIAACNQARFLYQHIQLEKFTLPIPELREGYIGFETSNTSLDLMRSEQFYLVTELEKAKPVSNISFKSKFTLQYGNYEHKKFIETDGRYYKFPPGEGGKTLDLGYNFIDRNGLEKRFEKNGK